MDLPSGSAPSLLSLLFAGLLLFVCLFLAFFLSFFPGPSAPRCLDLDSAQALDSGPVRRLVSAQAAEKDDDSSVRARQALPLGRG